MTFHNPYNFIPALPRADLPKGLADGRPPGHHRWHDDRWSGEIEVRLEVVTPLLLTREREADASGHRHLEIATTTDGRVDLPPTQLKGMLRSAYEAVTCSRFGVLDRRAVLGFRSVAEGAAELQPALVEAEDRVVVLGRIDGLRAAAAKVLWRHDHNDRTRLDPEFAHGDVVEAVIRRGDHGWEAVSLHRPGTQSPEGLIAERFLVRGRLHAPGPTIKSKRSESVFVTETLSEGLTQDKHHVITGTEAESLVVGLKTLIEHQREVHNPASGDRVWAEGRKPWDYEGHEPGKTAWSRHLYTVADRNDAEPPPYLGPDTVVPPPVGAVVTCWAETGNVERVRRKVSPTEATTVERLRPVLISRLLHTHAPGELLDESLRPATSIEQLSAADRVFGWTWNGDGNRPEPSAHRAALRVVDVRTPLTDDRTTRGTPAVENLEPLVLPPLSTPKPSQGRFYLAKKPRRPGDPPAPLDPGTDRYGFFHPASQQLRGRKVYPHHRGLEGHDTRKLRSRFSYTPPVADGRKRPERDSQNATLHQWINPGTVVTFTVRVTDLHPLELGALLWLLDPLRCGSSDGPGRHKLGGGRPLGFGSVELTVAAARLYRGDKMLDRLTMFAPEVELDDHDRLAVAFEAALPASAKPVLDALRRTFTGFGRNAEVHYPRNTPTSPIYEWFVENEKPPQAGARRRQALPVPGGTGLDTN